MLQMSWIDRWRRNHQRPLAAALMLMAFFAFSASAFGADPWVVYEGADGPGKGKHVVLVSGDEEYRSEEALPQLAKILARRARLQVHGALRHRQGRHDRPEPERQHPRPRSAPDGRPDDHLHALPQPARRADEGHRRLRRIGPADHRHAHGDARLQHRSSKTYAKYSWQQQGMGRRLRPAGARRDLGQPPRPPRPGRARAASSPPGARDNPILRGIKDGDIWGPTDVYGVHCRSAATASRWCSARCSRA